MGFSPLKVLVGTSPRRAAWQAGLLLLLWGLMAYLWWPAVWRVLPVPGVAGSIMVGGEARSFYVYVPAGLHPLKQHPALFFLQGLDTPDSPSGHTRQLYRFIASQADHFQFIAVFPRGRLGSFPEAAGTLAWYPDHFLENRRFLVQLAGYVLDHFPVDRENVLYAGFSNAGYFGGCEALFFRRSPFTGFWLDAGAYPYDMHRQAPRRNIFLTVGARDHFNRRHVETFADFLKKRGWREGKDLMMKVHPHAHILYQSDFGRIWSFLWRRNDPEI